MTSLEACINLQARRLIDLSTAFEHLTTKKVVSIRKAQVQIRLDIWKQTELNLRKIMSVFTNQKIIKD